MMNLDAQALETFKRLWNSNEYSHYESYKNIVVFIEDSIKSWEETGIPMTIDLKDLQGFFEMDTPSKVEEEFLKNPYVGNKYNIYTNRIKEGLKEYITKKLLFPESFVKEFMKEYYSEIKRKQEEQEEKRKQEEKRRQEELKELEEKRRREIQKTYDEKTEDLNRTLERFDNIIKDRQKKNLELDKKWESYQTPEKIKETKENLRKEKKIVYGYREKKNISNAIQEYIEFLEKNLFVDPYLGEDIYKTGGMAGLSVIPFNNKPYFPEYKERISLENFNKLDLYDKEFKFYGSERFQLESYIDCFQNCFQTKVDFEIIAYTIHPALLYKLLQLEVEFSKKLYFVQVGSMYSEFDFLQFKKLCKRARRTVIY